MEAANAELYLELQKAIEEEVAAKTHHEWRAASHRVNQLYMKIEREKWYAKKNKPSLWRRGLNLFLSLWNQDKSAR